MTEVPKGPPPDACADDEVALRDASGKTPNGRLLFYSDAGESICMENRFKGRHVFIICSGPSLNNYDLSELRKPGIVTLGVNNSPIKFRPDMWICVDRPGNFIDTIWKDASITKFAPLSAITKKLHVRKDDGTFRQSKFTCGDMPNIWYYKRNEKFNAETYLTEPTVNWGSKGDYVDHLGVKGSRSVMLAAIRLVHNLGFSRVYLLGADFTMNGRQEQNYAWAQKRTQSSIRGNNSTYAALNTRLAAIKPKLDADNCKVYNCFAETDCKVFPHIDFAKAIAQASKESVKEVGTDGWYDHGKLK